VVLVDRVAHGIGNIGTPQTGVQLAAETLHQFLGAAVHVEDFVVRRGVAQHHDVVHVVHHLHHLLDFQIFFQQFLLGWSAKESHGTPPNDCWYAKHYNREEGNCKQRRDRL